MQAERLGPVVEIAVRAPELLGRFYDGNHNHKTSIAQLPVLTEWAAFPGENSLKIIEVVKSHTEALVTGRRKAEDVMPDLSKDIRALLPTCKSE